MATTITNKIVTLDDTSIIGHINPKWMARGTDGELIPNWFMPVNARTKVIIFVENDTLPTNLDSQELYVDMDMDWYKFDITSSTHFYNYTRFRSDSFILNTNTWTQSGYTYTNGCSGCLGNPVYGLTDDSVLPLPFFYFVRGDGYKNMHQGSAALATDELKSYLEMIDPETWDDWELDPWGAKPWQTSKVRSGAVPKAEDAILKTMSGKNIPKKYNFRKKERLVAAVNEWKVEKAARAAAQNQSE